MRGVYFAACVGCVLYFGGEPTTIACDHNTHPGRVLVLALLIVVYHARPVGEVLFVRQRTGWGLNPLAHDVGETPEPTSVRQSC